MLKAPFRARNLAIKELAPACGAGAATVQRLCCDLGYEGYKDFQLDLAVGAQAWQQAIAAAMSEESLVDYARKPENQALRRALEKWGYIDRPKSPWLRVAPKFHPKHFEFAD